MDGSFKIARFLGFDISIHWSWIFIFLLITWTFSIGILQEFFPEWGVGARWAAAATVALIFFLSILVHELSHAVMARRFGIPVAGITLFVFGGVSHLGRESETPRQEFLVAVVGPLASFAAGIFFLAGYFIFWPVSEGVGAISLNLAVINFAIGLFNLVPGYPLDGGRILRSVLWSRQKNVLQATKGASRAGIVVAYTIMGLGVLSFFFVNVISGFWLFLIGMFLRAAAETSYRQLLRQSILASVPARIMHTEVTHVPPQISVNELVENYILPGKGRAFPVADNGTTLGLVTLTDVQRVPREHWTVTRVSQAMTPESNLKTVQPDEDLSRVLDLMGTGDINQVPIMEGGRVQGMIYRSDLIRYVQTREQVLSASGNLEKEAARPSTAP